MGWRYFATTLHGDGTETPLADALPLLDVEIYDDLSGPGGLSATLSPEAARLKGPDGRPLLREWSTAIYAEKDGQVRGGGILRKATPDGPALELDVVGIPGYAYKTPWVGAEYSDVQVDPLDVVRTVWAHLQAAPGGNLGLVVDDTSSPVRIGTEEETTEFTTGSGESVSFESGPVRLAEWQTDDLGKVIDDLAKETPFDYHVETERDGDTISHRLRLGYPRLGRRRHDLRFVVGENVYTPPVVTSSEYADEVLVLGSGEGRDMVRGSWTLPSDRLRRVAIVEAKDVRSRSAAQRIAEREARARTGEPALTDELEAADHPSAPIGSYSPGDEILVRSPHGWEEGLEVWHRILSLTIRPDLDTVTLALARAE